MFISGFLALCSAVGTGTCTEVGGGDYARQAIAFGTPRNGLSLSVTPYSFGYPAMTGPVAGRAIFDAPTGGNLLLVLPHATPRPIAGPIDTADAGFISLFFTAMQNYPDGSAFSGAFTAGSTVGSCYDELEVLARGAKVAGGGYVPAAINSSPMTAGVALTVKRGLLSATSAWTA